MKPEKQDYPEYYERYLNLVKETEPVEALENNWKAIEQFVKAIPAAKADYAYAPEKWTVKQVLQHIIDTERIFAYRALRFARNDNQLLPSFEENDYAAAARVSERTMADLLEEFETVRKATLSMARHLNTEELMRRGQLMAGPISVLALLYTCCGHAQHHLNIINERYLN